jgi:soluble lytic murein transglycosylase-like protein
VTTPDPVADVLQLVTTHAHAAGVRDGRRASSRWAFLRGFVAGVLLAVLIIGWAVAAAQVPARAEQYRRDLTRIAISVWGLDAPVSLLAGQIEQESGWRTDAVSWAGAKGLAQFMDATGRDVAARYGGGAPNPFDPRWAMMAQSRHMRELHGAIGRVRNDTERFAFALAGYNGGLRWVRARQALSTDPGRCLGLTCDINPGIRASAQRENREYPRRILLVLAPRYHAAGWGGPDLFSHLAAGG